MGNKNIHQPVVVGVDLDGVVARRTRERSFDFANFEPIPEAIAKVNTLFDRGFVIIYHSARPEEYYAVTMAWLHLHGARFHALRLGKMRATYYVDDRSSTLDALLEGSLQP